MTLPSYAGMDQTISESSEALHARASALWNEGQPHEALTVYAQAVAALAADAPAQTIVKIKGDYAMCLRQLNMLDEALAIYPELETLCTEADLDPTRVLRQWAIALESKRELSQARALYEKIRPADAAPASERLLWHHAVGLLDWTDGRFLDAEAQLAAAADLMPEAPEEAAPLLAVLGNYGTLSLTLGHPARALRLADRMIEISEAVPKMPLSAIATSASLRAALLHQRSAWEQEAQVLKDSLDWMTRNDPKKKEWPTRLDMAGRYAAAAQRTDAASEARAQLARLTAEAPENSAWIGHYALAPLLIDSGDAAGARASLVAVLASIIGVQAPEREVEVVALLAGLANLQERRDAAILLGKLTLRYLALVAHDATGEALHSLLAVSARLTRDTCAHLAEAGRYQELAAIEALAERLGPAALTRRPPSDSRQAAQPVPFDTAETRMEARWLDWRQDLATLREAGKLAEARALADSLIDTLLDFRTASGLDRPRPEIPGPPPSVGTVRLRLLPMGAAVEVQYRWSDREEVHRHDIPARAVFRDIAELRAAVSDPKAWLRPATALYHLLIGPIADRLEALDTLEVEAQGALGALPLGLLSDGETCLAERVTIRYGLAMEAPPRSAVPRRGLAHFGAFANGPLAPGLQLDLACGATDGAAPLDPLTNTTGPAFTQAALTRALEDRPAYLCVASHLAREATRPDLSSLLLGDETPLYLADLAGDRFDLNGIRLAVLATCSSAMTDVTETQDSSLVALVLAKGADCVLGTLWDIPESAAAAFLAAFWQAFARDPSQDPARCLATLQGENARRALEGTTRASLAGGIGSPSHSYTPDIWAGFAIFENRNRPQPAP